MNESEAETQFVRLLASIPWTDEGQQQLRELILNLNERMKRHAALDSHTGISGRVLTLEQKEELRRVDDITQERLRQERAAVLSREEAERKADHSRQQFVLLVLSSVLTVTINMLFHFKIL